MIAALLLNAAAFAYLAYSSLWLQTVLRLSPVGAGLPGAAPLALTTFVVSVVIGRFLHAPNPRWIIGGGMALVGAGALLQAALSAAVGLDASAAGPDRGRGRAWGWRHRRWSPAPWRPCRCTAAGWQPVPSTRRTSSASPSGWRCWAAFSLPAWLPSWRTRAGTRPSAQAISGGQAQRAARPASLAASGALSASSSTPPRPPG